MSGADTVLWRRQAAEPAASVTLCHSSGPATGLKGRVGDPERSQAGGTNPDTYRARPTCKQAEAHELVSNLAFL